MSSARLLNFELRTTGRQLPRVARMLRRPAKVLSAIILGLQGGCTCPKATPPFHMKLAIAHVEQGSQPKETEIAEIAGSGSRLFQHHACASRHAPVADKTGERLHGAMEPAKRNINCRDHWRRLRRFFTKRLRIPSTRRWPTCMLA